MWNNLVAFMKKHDSYITGMLVWANIVGCLQNLSEGSYGWALASAVIVIWFQYDYNKKKSDEFNN